PHLRSRTVAVDAAPLELRALAEQRHRDPTAVRDRATALLDDADLAPAAIPVGEWVLGLTLHELGEPGPAADHLRRAARQARRGGDAETEALARAGLAISLLRLGGGRAGPGPGGGAGRPISLLGGGRAPAARREIALADERAPQSARGRVDF